MINPQTYPRIIVVTMIRIFPKLLLPTELFVNLYEYVNVSFVPGTKVLVSAILFVNAFGE